MSRSDAYESLFLKAASAASKKGDNILAACCYRILGKDELVEVELSGEEQGVWSIISSFVGMEFPVCAYLIKAQEHLFANEEAKKAILEAIYMTICILDEDIDVVTYRKSDAVNMINNAIEKLVYARDEKLAAVALILREIILKYLEDFDE